MIERRTIVFSHERLGGIELPAFEARGERDGPRVSLIAGVHGCEYSSIAAVTRFMNELDATELAGTIVAVPVVSMQSFEQRSPFVVPEDGKNLNRCFPGDYDGTYTDVLARSIFEELIEPADFLLDLHAGDQPEALEPFAIYQESEVAAQAHELAVAFGLRYVIRQERGDDSLAGLTSSAAAQVGIPAIIAEAGGRGLLEESAVQPLVRGVRNVLRHLEMLPGEPDPSPDQRFVRRFIWLRSEQAGWWQPAVEPGAEVAEGSLLGELRNLWGDVLEEVRSPADGVILFVTTSPAVAADGLVLGLGAGVTPLAQ
jgi:predicted deacylase